MKEPVALTLPEFAAVSVAVSNIVELLDVPLSNVSALLGVSKVETQLYLSGVGTGLLHDIDRQRDLIDLVRMYRALASIIPDPASAIAWLRGENLALNGVPLDLMRSRQGLSLVVGYLESHVG